MAEELQHFEPRFWGLDPVFSTSVRLNIIDVLCLQPHPSISEVYCISNHPVQNVHIMGDVVSIQKKSRMIKYEVDDGTGVLSCTHWRQEEDSDRGLVIPRLGQLVAMWGKLSEYREEKQLTVTAIVEQEDPNAEPLHWLEVAWLKRTVYSCPFSLPSGLLPSGPRSLKDKVRETVLKFLKDTYSRKYFTLSELSASVELIAKACRESSMGEGEGEEEEEAVAKEVAPAIEELAETGVIIPALGVGRHIETKYEIFSMKKHLCPAILDFIKTKEKTTESVGRLGVPESWIVKYIQQREAFHKLPAEVITEGIEELTGESLIYPLTPNSYRSVT